MKTRPEHGLIRERAQRLLTGPDDQDDQECFQMHVPGTEWSRLRDTCSASV